jgi:hypothetical protein
VLRLASPCGDFVAPNWWLNDLMASLMPSRQIASAVLTVLLFGCRAAFAQSCVISGAHYNLTADTVSWSMKIDSGHHCSRGVRFANVEFESVALISPPQSGQVTLEGWGFTYAAKDDFRGQDLFAVKVFGKIRKRPGTSTIRILVSVVGTELSNGTPKN